MAAPEMSPGSFDVPKSIVIVMDGLKDPSMQLLAWVLEHIISDGTWTITLLQVLPWLNIPLSYKKWSEEVMMDIHNLCRNYGVIPQVTTLMGFPRRLLVVEQLASLNPTLVAIDRHHDKKDIEFYAEKAPCNIVAMNDRGEYYVINSTCSAHYNFTEHSSAPTPEL